MIQFQDITLQYEGRNLIEALNEHIKIGEKVVIAGPSGSGKSSLLSLITGFIAPSKGEIWLNNQRVDTTSGTNVRDVIAWVPQEFYLPYENALELITVLFQLKVNRKQPFPTDDEITVLLSEVGLSMDYLTKSFKEQSGGERQRILIVVALLLKKPLLLLDEPTSALDADSVKRVITLLKKQKVTMVAVSHDAQFINSFDRVIYLKGNE
ncbi:MAG: ATP-binding cassette domain-containing protein [Marinifilaceae bacterium]